MTLSAIMLWSHIVQPFSGPYGPVARLPVSTTLLGETSFPLGRDTSFPFILKTLDDSEKDCFAVASVPQGAIIRAATNQEVLSCSLPYAFFARTGNKRGPVYFERGKVSIRTVDGPVALTDLRRFSFSSYASETDIFQDDLFTAAVQPADTIPQLFGERTDASGIPLRWSKTLPSDSDLRVCLPKKHSDPELIQRLIHGLNVLSVEANYSAQAGRYRDFVNRYSEKYNLASSLVLAIMHTESNFNPFAISPSSAVGLMQIVPDTAGNEVYRYLMGTHGSPSIETLFAPEHNIRYGATYLHLLGQRYFGRVSNPSSRQMCVIAAYNGGPGAVLRLFAANQDEALDIINGLTPSEVYTALTTQMPSQETRRYVELVLARIQDYSVY